MMVILSFSLVSALIVYLLHIGTCLFLKKGATWPKLGNYFISGLLQLEFLKSHIYFIFILIITVVTV